MDRTQNFYNKYNKRTLDFILGIILLIILLIPLLIIFFSIFITEGAPVIFKQTRVGKGGKTFQIYKFRTMVKNAEKLGPSSTANNDNRITKIGRMLRKTSLDELPQIFNVIKGNMSFIGYRPDIVRDEDDYSDIKYKLKPGITGYAQVNGRSSLTIEEAEYWENKYAEDICFCVDMKIIFKTISSVLTKNGTN